MFWQVTLLNFTVNAAGLEDQLLGLVVGKERPELQDAKNQLVVSMAAMRKTQKDLEDKILKLLAESEGDILDDESLINVLGEAKVTSDDISVKVEEAEKTEKEIDETRERYAAVTAVTYTRSRVRAPGPLRLCVCWWPAPCVSTGPCMSTGTGRRPSAARCSSSACRTLRW